MMGMVLSQAEVSRRPAGTAWVLATVLGGLIGLLILLVSPDSQAWQMDVVSLLGQPDWLDQLAYLLTSIEVGMMVGIGLLFLALVSSLVQLIGGEASSHNGHAYPRQGG
jgi:hypothetical protein